MEASPLEAVKERAKALLKNHPEVRFAFLFGSAVLGRTTPLSDVDLAVYVSDLSPSRDIRSELTSELMGALKRNDVDLVLLNSAPPLLRHRILTQGECLLVRDPLEEQRFFVRTLQEYFDTAPLRSIQARHLSDYLRKLQSSKDN